MTDQFQFQELDIRGYNVTALQGITLLNLIRSQKTGFLRDSQMNSQSACIQLRESHIQWREKWSAAIQDHE